VQADQRAMLGTGRFERRSRISFQLSADAGSKVSSGRNRQAHIHR
jgi:hypothetical protein